MITTRFITLFTLLATGCTAIVESPEDLEPSPTGEPADDSGSGATTSSDPTAELDPASPIRVLPVRYEAQETGYWCGPAATKMALSARIAPPSQGALAGQLGTTTNGTDWVGQITNVLNTNLRAKWFVTRELPNDPPTPGQRDLLWKDLTRAIDAGFPFVANIVAPPTNHPPGYPNRTIYHYFTVAGYNRDTRQVFISDSARFSGMEQYWIPFDQLATLIPPKGYTALAPCTREVVVGQISEKYDALGACNSIIGTPITEERKAPDGVGRYSVFERGSIYWSPTTGAHEVHGRIRDAWAAAGWEAGDLGYPISDEYVVDGGRRSDFEGGSIVWTAATNSTQIVD